MKIKWNKVDKATALYIANKDHTLVTSIWTGEYPKHGKHSLPKQSILDHFNAIEVSRVDFFITEEALIYLTTIHKIFYL